MYLGNLFVCCFLRAESSLGPCFFVVKENADVFSRVILCFSLTSDNNVQLSPSISFEAFLSQDM